MSKKLMSNDNSTCRDESSHVDSIDARKTLKSKVKETESSEQDLAMGDGSDANDSLDGDDDDNEQAKLFEHLRQLKQQVEFNPTYELYESYIECLKQAHELNTLRITRQEFAERFPLAQNIWLSWIDDESKLCIDDVSKTKLRELFKKALIDCPVSVEVWEKYCAFMVSWMSEKDPVSVNNAREVFESAVGSVGMDYTHGHRIWVAYRAFEGYENGATLDDNHAAKKLFHREISMVSAHSEEVFNEYSSLTQSVQPHIQASHFKSLSLREKRKPFEICIAETTDESSVNTYRSYIEFELTQKPLHVVRVQNLYERALVLLFNDEKMWLQYLRFLRQHLPQFAMDVCLRAVRNCQWSSQVWCAKIRCAEMLAFSVEKVEAICEEALSVQFSNGNDFVLVAMELCCYHRRRVILSTDTTDTTTPIIVSDSDTAIIRAAFERAATFAQYEKSLSHTTYILYTLWANTEVYLGAFDKALQRWQCIVEKSGKDSRACIEFVSFLRHHGHINACRKAFRRILHVCRSDVWTLPTLCQKFVQFEHEMGTIKTIDDAERRCERVLAELNDAVTRQKHAETKRNAKAANRPAALKRSNDAKSDDEPVAKKARSHTHTDVAESKSASHDKHTAFVLNLSWSVKEKQLEKDFAAYGKVLSARVVRDYRGRSKGFAYVDFESQMGIDAVVNALNEQEYRGRIVKVSRSCPDANKNTTQSSANRPTYHEIFLRGLDNHQTAHNINSAIRTLFEPCGVINDVVIPTTANSNTAKGFAFVVFDSQSSVDAALQMNPIELLGAKACIKPSKAKRQTMKSVSATVRHNHNRNETPAATHSNEDLISTTSEKLPQTNTDFRQLLFKPTGLIKK